MLPREQKRWTILVTALLLTALLWAGREETSQVNSGKIDTAKTRPRVVIDAGHGGMDPGKIGINGAEEKDVNLRIALLVKRYLELQDVEVILTRETAEGLYDDSVSNKKVQDMKRRIEIIEESDPVLTVSIHQNSYPEEYVSGAQVFYYTESREGHRLAELLQRSFVQRLDPSNHRQAKANNSYYLLKKTSTPIVIAECGFLSNWAEAEKLCDEAYQERVAWAIQMGILQYLHTQNDV
ncbi:MAG: N-acetylmuramoyl-L-alanine amidase [Lachnospiraceae bacterium]|nr:N-acetylmuramoyl-L-alanine amidase [Lachnospiraceae bacterium]